MPLRYLYLQGQDARSDKVPLKANIRPDNESLEKGVVDELNLDDWESWMRWDTGTADLLNPILEPQETPTGSPCSRDTCFSDIDFPGKDNETPSLSPRNVLAPKDAPFEVDEDIGPSRLSPGRQTASLTENEQPSDDLIIQFPVELPAIGAPDSTSSVSTIRTRNDAKIVRSKFARPLQMDSPSRRGKRRRDLEDPDTDTTGSSKKRGHNAIEKRYRTNLNEKINCLRDAIPSAAKTGPDAKAGEDESEEDDLDSKSGQQKFGKAAVLTRALDYIKHLENSTEKLGKDIDVLKSRVGAFERLAMSGSGDEQAAKAPTPAKDSTLDRIQEDFKLIKTKPRPRSRLTPDPTLICKRGRKPNKVPV